MLWIHVYICIEVERLKTWPKKRTPTLSYNFITGFALMLMKKVACIVSNDRRVCIYMYIYLWPHWPFGNILYLYIYLYTLSKINNQYYSRMRIVRFTVPIQAYIITVLSFSLALSNHMMFKCYCRGKLFAVFPYQTFVNIKRLHNALIAMLYTHSLIYYTYM